MLTWTVQTSYDRTLTTYSATDSRSSEFSIGPTRTVFEPDVIQWRATVIHYEVDRRRGRTVPVFYRIGVFRTVEGAQAAAERSAIH